MTCHSVWNEIKNEYLFTLVHRKRHSFKNKEFTFLQATLGNFSQKKQNANKNGGIIMAFKCEK